MSNYLEEEKDILLKLAANAIKHGLDTQEVLPLTIKHYPEKLQILGASFVTLAINNQLRGCIGTLEAYQPLVQDIAQNAYAAAFRDPRFLSLTDAEYKNTSIHISILSKPTPISFTSEDDLLRQIRPGTDGLIISDRGYRGTFLPAVWESLPTPELFLKHLKLKAGLSENYWSETLQVAKYTVEVIK